jgi:hypothetical protein
MECKKNGNGMMQCLHEINMNMIMVVVKKKNKHGLVSQKLGIKGY